MDLKKSFCVGILYLLLIMANTATAENTNLYVIPSWSSGDVMSYEIDGLDLNYQATCTNLKGLGVGLAIDSELGFIYKTTEREAYIEIIDVNSLEYIKDIPLPDEYEDLNLAGIVADIE